MGKYCMNRKQQKVQGVFYQPAKRVNIVSLKLVREGSVLYKERRVQ
ncbi:hypothetical protein GFC30_463 [Anoxybacillus amylolyticus]|uniref:Uncharacterized protein n=1 Tax=Anoxybacteroides amylolyticum TaxID=294699 RepID=A0A160F1N9_9BACL|nr:hypothetical protein [Anoxybacillus amylolyticus]ANB59323.1 hypothetical protein GFC30_463 [Anoxybacillus amylolyticus]